MEYKNKRGVNIGLYYLKQKGYSEVLKENRRNAGDLYTYWRRRTRLHLKPEQKHVSTRVTFTRGVGRPQELQKLEHFTALGMHFQLLPSPGSKQVLQNITELDETIFPLYHRKIKELEQGEGPKHRLLNFKSPPSKGGRRGEGRIWFIPYKS